MLRHDVHDDGVVVPAVAPAVIGRVGGVPLEGARVEGLGFGERLLDDLRDIRLEAECDLGVLCVLHMCLMCIHWDSNATQCYVQIPVVARTYIYVYYV